MPIGSPLAGFLYNTATLLTLRRAAWLGDTAAIAESASAGGDVNARDRKGQSALQFAAGAGQGGVMCAAEFTPPMVQVRLEPCGLLSEQHAF